MNRARTLRLALVSVTAAMCAYLVASHGRHLGRDAGVALVLIVIMGCIVAAHGGNDRLP